jgi:uncharacterized protein (UPF0276 family)
MNVAATKVVACTIREPPPTEAALLLQSLKNDFVEAHTNNWLSMSGSVGVRVVSRGKQIDSSS